MTNNTTICPNRKDFYLLLKKFGRKKMERLLQESYEKNFTDYLTMCPCCPKCLSTRVNFFDLCTRYVYIDAFITYLLQISRVKCTDCLHISRILPPYLIPFKRYILSFVCKVIHSTQTKAGLSKEYRISRRLIGYWQNQFRKWHELGVTVIELSFPLDDYTPFQSRYQKEFTYYFMQVLPATAEHKNKN